VQKQQPLDHKFWYTCWWKIYYYVVTNARISFASTL